MQIAVTVLCPSTLTRVCSLSLAKTQAEPTSSGSTVLSTEKEDREARVLRSQIKLNEAFNGIKFKSTEWEVVHKGMEESEIFMVSQ